MVDNVNKVIESSVSSANIQGDTVRGVNIRTEMSQSANGSPAAREIIMESKGLQVHYGDYLAVRNVDLQIHKMKSRPSSDLPAVVSQPLFDASTE